MAVDPRVPQFKAALIDAVGALLSWVADSRMGAVYLRNAGPDECFMAWEQIPPAATIGNGRFRLRVGESFNLDATRFDELGFICAMGDTAVIEAAGMVRPGNAGGGIVA